MRFTCLYVLLGVVAVRSKADDSSTATKKQPPSFFLQDPTDGLCLHGDTFTRCSIDTLFYVVGSPGSYQIHKRPIDATEKDLSLSEEDGICISKKQCHKDSDNKPPSSVDVKLTKCSHCGAKNWNILGDADTGYVLTEGEDKHKVCLVRDKSNDKKHNNKVTMIPCDTETVPFTALQLQFTTATDIDAMSSPAARLIGAASDGDKKLIQSLLKEGSVDVNTRDWDDLTALIPAASSGNIDIIKLLLKEGADVNAKDKDGINALMEAAIMGHVKIAELLVEAGADVNAKANSDVSALWLAAGEGKTDSVKYLLSKDAEADVARSDGITCLHTSSIGGHTDVVKMLLDAGANPKARDSDGLTPLLNAAENGTVAIMKALIDAAGEPKDEGEEKYINMISDTGFTALIIASAHGHKDAVEYLLDLGADVEATAENGVTVLMYAAASGHLPAMEVLLKKGKADVNKKHVNGGTALLEASSAGSAEAMKMLIDYGSAYDFIDDDGVTPLMAVASQGHFEGQTLIVNKLKESLSEDEFKKHINLASHSGGTSVMFSAAGGHYNCTKQLIEVGADINAIAKATPEYMVKYEKMVADGTYQDDEPHVDGVTAILVAAQSGHLDCVELLLEHGAKVDVLDDDKRSALSLAVKGNYGDVAAVLVKGGADPNTQYVDEDGDTHNLLMDAITVENEEFASLLIEKGADLTYTDEKDVNTLLQASHRGLLNITKLLIEKSAAKPEYINSPSDEGVTPLIAAASEGHTDIVKVLVEDGKADINAKDKDGTNSLMAASARGHKDAVEILLKAGANVNEQNDDGHTALMFAYNGKNQVETLWERYNQYVVESKTSDTDATEAAKNTKKIKDTEEEIDDGGTGPIIRDALDNHTSLVDMLLKNGADTKIKDKEGHVAADFDYNPEETTTSSSSTDSSTSKIKDDEASTDDETKKEL